jgi:ABC-2 type transport system permease protein
MKNLKWIFALAKINWYNMITNINAFYVMTLSMCIQNLIHFSLWFIVFKQISSLRGWQLQDVSFLLANATLGYGILFFIFGGVNQIANMIHSGEIDLYMVKPKSTLILVLLRCMRADSVGDILTGAIMLMLFVEKNTSLLLIGTLILSSGIVMFSVRLICHTCAFWGINHEGSERNFMAFMVMATNPQNGFKPLFKAILLSIFPAGYIGYLPVEIIRSPNWMLLLLQVSGSMLILIFAIWFFQIGLRYYNSGNRFLTLR